MRQGQTHGTHKDRWPGGGRRATSVSRSEEALLRRDARESAPRAHVGDAHAGVENEHVGCDPYTRAGTEIFSQSSVTSPKIQNPYPHFVFLVSL